jgi:hypothetical protein
MLFDTFQLGFLFMLEMDMPSVIFDIGSSACPIALKFLW